MQLTSYEYETLAFAARSQLITCKAAAENARRMGADPTAFIADTARWQRVWDALRTKEPISYGVQGIT